MLSAYTYEDIMLTVQLFLVYTLTDRVKTDHFDVSSKAPLTDFCDAETFHAECQVNEVIVMETARYGRMRMGRCVETAMGFVGCFRDVLGLTDQRCSGKRSCDIYIPNAEFEATRPCLKELKSYMEASYVCVPIVSVTAEHCHDNEELRVSGLTSGYLASVVTSDTPGCTGRSWELEAGQGQRINITLFDFTAGLRPPRDPGDRLNKMVRNGDDVSSGCREYATAQEGQRETVLCGATGKGRKGTTFLTTGNILTVTMKAGIRPTDMQRFIIHFKVVGCVDPVSTGAVIYLRVSPVRAVGSCERSLKKTWIIQCTDSTWSDSSGEEDNCSSGSMLQRRANHPKRNFLVHLATMIAVPTLLLALGTSLAVVILQLRRKGRTSRRQETLGATTLLGSPPLLPPTSQETSLPTTSSSNCGENELRMHRSSPLPNVEDTIDSSSLSLSLQGPAATDSPTESTTGPTGLRTMRQQLLVTETLC